ncbi:MAG TPA: M1 family metallopeptidase [Pyrinomonadaceae bacterium]|nr:M1 family metallopeptidase [Pyrinomonadaceae bacterium]
MRNTALNLISILLLCVFSSNSHSQTSAAPQPSGPDLHSYANSTDVRVKHVDLDWQVLFAEKVLKGTAVLTVERVSQNKQAPLILDTKNLNIEKVETSSNGKTYSPGTFTLAGEDKILGSALTIPLPAKATRVRISYATRPTASGVQWLEPSQTAGKKNPFMFTQSQAIHARSWIPLQDTPSVRVTYNARVRTTPNLLAVMSAANDPGTPRDGDYSFAMRQPIPSYLIALAVGDLSFKPLSARTGVYAEPSVVNQAAQEFSDTEKMIQATEKLYGPYRWERYDMLVLPPSFPFGGMENPRLTFLTPTILAGDKSLVSLVAHELAHSWSGNLVTNATWRDFWLNEGFTVYLERRIQEAVYGKPRANMEAALGLRDLQDELGRLEDRDEILHVDLKGRDPDEGFTDVPYEKGALFLVHLEQTFGRERFDQFLRSYFDHFAFQSVTTEQFLSYLKANLLDKHPNMAATVPVTEWINNAGMPASAPKPSSPAFSEVEQQAQRWQRGEVAAGQIPVTTWSTQQWLHFLKSLPEKLDQKKMAELDQAFKLTQSGNSEIAFQWLMMSIKNAYQPAFTRVEEFLISIGRRKFIKPLYEELAKSPEGREFAMKIYRRARPTYHPIAVTSIDEVLKWNG